MGRQYSSVSELAKNLISDKSFQAELEKEISDKSLAKVLFTMRCAKGITQSQMAERLGCGQAKISKLENSPVDSVKVGDLVAYAKALELQLQIGFHSKMTATQCVAFHRNQMMKHLDHLFNLVKGDPEIGKGVAGVFRDNLIGIFKFFQDKVQDLPFPQANNQPALEITSPEEIEDQEPLCEKML